MQLALYRIPVARFFNEAVSLRIIQYKEGGLPATTDGCVESFSCQNTARDSMQSARTKERNK
jgi:hypothetical protein